MREANQNKDIIAGRLFGVVADDYTGATDEAGMLAKAGLCTGLLLGKPRLHDLKLKSTRYDAIVIGVQTRSVSPANARKICKECFELFKKVGANPVQFKYCSTFDSTEKGNIGPVIEAGLKCFKQKITIAVPALPINRRTTYLGYHFVGSKLLSDSHMRYHPLNPMLESNLVRFLSKQTALQVGLADLPTVRQGAKKLEEYFKTEAKNGRNILIVDCIEEKDLETIMSASRDLTFLSGGSGIGGHINSYYGENRKSGGVQARVNKLIKKPRIGALIISGSCSLPTLRQNEYARKHGFYKIQIDISELMRSGKITLNAVARRAESLLLRGMNVIVSSSQPINEREKYAGAIRAKKREAISFIIQKTLAEIARLVLSRTNCSRLIISGGETSGSVITACGLDFFEVLAEIDPGVPLIYAPARGILTVLKSGNFGALDFYAKALKTMERYYL